MDSDLVGRSEPQGTSARAMSGGPRYASLDDSHFLHLAPWLRLVRTLQMLRSHVRSGRRVLDVGCGDGTTMMHLGGNRVGVDVSMDVLKSAKARSGADVVLGSALALPFRDGSFDVVVCTEVLEHLDDVEGAIGQLAAVAKRDGTIHLTVPMASWYRLMLFRLLGIRPYYLSEEEHKREFSAVPVDRFSSVSSLLSSLERYGLRIEDVRGSYFFPDKMEGPLDEIVRGSTRLRAIAERLDAIANILPKMRYLGRYLALSCRKVM